MQPEKPVEVDCRFRPGFRRGNGDSRPQRVIVFLAKRDHHVQPIHRAALEHRDQNFLASAGRIRRAREPQRRGADAKHSKSSALEE